MISLRLLVIDFEKRLNVQTPNERMNVTMETMMELAVIFAILNAALLTALSVIYGRIVWRTRASHPIGLLIFALLLLLQNALTIYSYLAMAPFFPEESL